jgi:pilus assembly protein CpaF
MIEDMKERSPTIQSDLIEALMSGLDLSRNLTDAEILSCIEDRILDFGRAGRISVREMKQLTGEVFDSVRRLGPLQKYIDDESISEIMINGPDDIFIERNGKIEKAGARLESE